MTHMPVTLNHIKSNSGPNLLLAPDFLQKKHDTCTTFTVQVHQTEANCSIFNFHRTKQLN